MPGQVREKTGYNELIPCLRKEVEDCLSGEFLPCVKCKPNGYMGANRNASKLGEPERHADRMMELGRGSLWAEAVDVCRSHQCYLEIVSAFVKKSPERLTFWHHIVLCRYTGHCAFILGKQEMEGLFEKHSLPI